jgi:hypothetical protein
VTFFNPQPKPLPQAPEKKEPIRLQRDRALEAWSKAVRLLAGDECEIGDRATGGIQCRGPVDAAHVMGRGRAPHMRLVLENGVALCRAHHDALDRTRWFRPHFWAWFNNKYPGRKAQLEERARGGR